MVIKKLIGLIGLNDRIKVNICPTLREADGLAMSSRNTRLLPGDRKKAAAISAALHYLKQNLTTGDAKEIKEEAKEMLLQKEFRIDYIEIADADTLELIENWNGKQKIVALVAAFLNKVRLIDNLVINT